MFETVPGQAIQDQFPAWQDDGFTKQSGLSVGGGHFLVTVWQDTVVSGLPVTVSEIGTSGEYRVQYTPPSEGIWVVEIKVNTNQDVWKSRAFVGASADLTSVKADLDRILSLLHYNSILDNQTYDSFDQLLKARLRRFETAANIPATPGGSETAGLKHEHEIEAEYSGNNRATSFTLKKVL